MKNQMIVLLAAALIAQQANAQTTSSNASNTTTDTATTVLASADQQNMAANANVAKIDSKSNFGINYLGIFDGPAMDFHGSKRKAFTEKSDMLISHRPSFKYALTDAMDAGVQARFRTTFKPDGLNASLENSRLFMNFKKLLASDIGSLTLTPRIVMPMSDGMHDAKQTYSPELLAQYSIEPKNSRFSFNVGVQLIKDLYYSDAVASTDQEQLYTLGILEGAYQLSNKAQITFGFYPEAVKNTDVAYHTSSNELDLGVNIEVVKGWAVNPFFATEFNYLNAPGSGLLKSTGFTLVLTGSIL